VPGVRDEDSVDRGIREREVVGSRLVSAQARVALADEFQHSPIGLHHIELKPTLDQTIGQLPRARADLGNMRSDRRCQPVDGSVGVRRTPGVVLSGPAAEGGRACGLHIGILPVAVAAPP
jgi:hypothetical protein